MAMSPLTCIHRRQINTETTRQVTVIVFAGDRYKHGHSETDAFGGEDYRRILYAIFPLTKAELARVNDPAQRVLPYNYIRHMTPHMIAFADAKVLAQLVIT